MPIVPKELGSAKKEMAAPWSTSISVKMSGKLLGAPRDV
jgi:hypothetical protein